MFFCCSIDQFLSSLVKSNNVLVSILVASQWDRRVRPWRQNLFTMPVNNIHTCHYYSIMKHSYCRGYVQGMNNNTYRLLLLEVGRFNFGMSDNIAFSLSSSLPPPFFKASLVIGVSELCFQFFPGDSDDGDGEKYEFPSFPVLAVA